MSYASKSSKHNALALLVTTFFLTFFQACLSSSEYGRTRTTTFRHGEERKGILHSSIAKHRHHHYNEDGSNIRDIPQEENRFYEYSRNNISVHIKFRVAPDEFTSLNTLKDFVKLKSLGLQKNAVLELLIVSDHLGDNSAHRYLAKVTRNNHLLAKSFTKTYFKEDGSGDMVIEAPNSREREVNQCFYTGTVQSHESLVSLNLCDGIHGIIEIDSAVFHIESEKHDSHFLFQMIPQDLADDDVTDHNCGTDDYSDGVPDLHNRVRRQIKGPPGMDKNTRFVEMYVVIDNALYTRAGSVDAAVNRAINIVNYASGLYRQMNIYLAMIGVEVWSDRNRIDLHDGISSDETLTEFLDYRSRTINDKINNDNAQLFVGVQFANSTVGKGITTGICMNTWSAAVSADLKQNDYRVAATTMAHELGHNLGLPHDNSKAYEGKDCSCPQGSSGKCIMYSVSLSTQPKEFSQCSVDKIREGFEQFDRDLCLLNIPEELTMSGSTPICGNYFIEEGEECDCGLPEDCKSRCCDPTTCKLTVNSTCANGMCCDLNTCNVKPKAHPCRTLQDNHCDLGEFCDGESPWCPDDTYVANGVPCINVGDGFCYGGKCSTHNSQCAYLWGDKVQKSDDWCYVQNVAGDYYGNCGYDFYLDEEDNQGLTYKKCSQADHQCGLLHCHTEEKTSLIGIQPATYYAYGPAGREESIYCRSVIFNVGRSVFNPGMVPNGVKCGPNNMCVDHRCVEAPSVPDTCECHGRGKCNQYNECHCEAGWDPPFCMGRGDGGSVRSGPASDYDHSLVLKIGFGVFFGLGVPLVLAVLALIYWKRQRLREILKRLGFMRSYTQPPLKASPLHRLRPTQTEVESNGSLDKGNISTPVLQSTTNNTAPFRQGTEIKQTRTPPPLPSPPKPMITAQATHSNTPISATAPSKKVGPPRPRPPSAAENSTKSTTGISSIADKVAMFSSKPIVQVIPSAQQESAVKFAKPTYENVSKSSSKPLPRPPVKPKPSVKPTNT